MYGATDLVTPEAFVEQLAELGRRASAKLAPLHNKQVAGAAQMLADLT